jgi:Ca2+-binding EF-hand superfamily protein
MTLFFFCILQASLTSAKTLDAFELFKYFDKDQDGILTRDQFIQGLFSYLQEFVGFT